jgi:hypothetical protein
MNDVRTVPHDPLLPQLASALDGDAMCRVFDAALRARNGQRVTACRVDRVKYRPRRNCSVSWQLELEDERSGTRYAQRVAGRLCAAGEAAPRHARHVARTALPSRCGVSSLLLPQLELFAWFVPNDPRLAALGGLCEAIGGGGDALREAARALLGPGAQAPRQMSAELVQYVPESRACARFDVASADGPVRRLYAKIERGDGGAATEAVMRALYASPARAEGRLAMARPLLWQPAAGLHWQEGVAGTPLLELHPHCPPALAARVARVVAALHDTPAPLARRIDAADLLDHPRACAALLGTVEPRWTPLLDALLDALAAGEAMLHDLPAVTLHGDLHPRNILVDGERLVLIDLDSARAGAAALDLGAWIANTLSRALVAGAALAPAQACAAHFLQAYRAASRHAATDAVVAWATARALLCERAHSSVANLKPGHYPRVGALLELACFIARHGLDRPLPAL